MKIVLKRIKKFSENEESSGLSTAGKVAMGAGALSLGGAAHFNYKSP